MRSTMIGVFIFALQVFGFICGYTHQTSLKTTSNFSLHDSFLPANLKGIDIRIIGSFWSHVQVKRCSSRRRRGRHVRRCASSKYLYLCILLLLVSNDIHRNPGPPLGKNTLNISSFNARSIVNKRLELQSHVALINPDIIAITETWLHEGIADNEILPSSYNVPRNDRGSRGGGVLLAVKSNISCSRRPDLEEDICELLWAEIPLKNSGSYFLGVFYRPPSSDMNYLEGLKRSLEKVTVVSDHTNIVLLGDFNFPDIDWDLICPSQPNVLSDYFCDNIVNFYGFSQLIDEPARQDAILDRYPCDI